MRTVTGALVLLAALVAPSVAGAALPECLITCSVTDDCCAEEPCLREPCGAYLDCLSGAQVFFDNCIASIANDPRCRSTGGGRCTITLGCVKKCRSGRKNIERNCRRQFRQLSGACPSCDKPLTAAQQKSVANICKTSCSDAIAPPTTTTSTTSSTSTSTVEGATTSSTSTSTTTASSTRPPTTVVPASTCARPEIPRCQQACLLRITSLKKNYDRCDSACDGDQCAENICKQTARNIACEAIRARCTQDGNNADPQFLNCCGNNCPTLDDVDAELCRILPTTTSTTSTTSTSVASTTSTTTTTLGTVGAIFGWGN